MPQSPLPDPPFRARAWAFVRVAPLVALLGASLLLANLVQTASLALLPFSPERFRRANRFVAGAWWGACVTASRRAHGFRIRVGGDPVPMRENALIVANHQTMTDIVVLMTLARSKDRLGDLKFFVKDAIKWVPGIGWGMWFLDCIFVRRDWARDRASVEETFSRLVRARAPVWLVSFSEGTRLTPRKLEVSNGFAAGRGLAPTRHVLQPRPNGFRASVHGLRGHIDAVYDVTIAYATGVPTLGQLIGGLVKEVHVDVRRHPIASLPETEEDLSAWIRGAFARKDDRLERFYAEGAFPEP